MSAAVTHRRCGSDWQLSPVENILVWHWLTGITCGQNFGVALTEVSPEYWCGTDSYHTQKKRLVWHWLTVITYRKKRLVWHGLTVITYGKILVWHWLTVITYGKYWCGTVTDWQLSPMEKILVWHWLSYYLCKTILVWHWLSYYLCKKILVWHWLSYYLWGKHWYGTDCYHLWREKNIGVALTGSCQLWKKHWCGTNWQLTPMEIFFYWCGTGWQLSPVDKKKLVWNWLRYHMWKNIGVALADSYYLWKKEEKMV